MRKLCDMKLKNCLQDVLNESVQLNPTRCRQPTHYKFDMKTQFKKHIFGTRNHLISSQSRNLGDLRGITDDVATIPFHHFLSSEVLKQSPNTIPVHSLMLYSHLFFCVPLLLAPFTVPCRIVFTMPEDLEMCPYNLSFFFFYHG